jgi:glycosyltransferase involved in cell wall biosynthesis
MKVSVILPVFNEAENVRKTIGKTEKVLRELGLEHEIIAVDDGSTDGTWDELKAAASEIDGLKLVRCNGNGGKGQALKLGFGRSSGDIVAFFDAGGEYSPGHLVQFLLLMDGEKAEVVIGSKRHPESKVKYPVRRIFWSAVHNLAVKIFLGLPVRDTQVGVKVFKREVLGEVMPLLLVKRYAFDVELLANVHRRGYKIVEAPIKLNFKLGSEKIGFKDIFRIALDILAISYRMRVLKYYDRVKGKVFQVGS